MIIDAHNHVMTWENLPDAYWDSMAQLISNIIKEVVGNDVTPEQVKKNHLDGMMDTDGSKLIKNMDTSGGGYDLYPGLGLGVRIRGSKADGR